MVRSPLKAGQKTSVISPSKKGYIAREFASSHITDEQFHALAQKVSRSQKSTFICSFN